MSGTNISDIATDLTTCPYCGSEPGQRCLTKNGHVASYSHGARTWPLSRAFSAGFAEGQEDILLAIEDAERGTAWAIDYLRRQREYLGSRTGDAR